MAFDPGQVWPKRQGTDYGNALDLADEIIETAPVAFHWLDLDMPADFRFARHALARLIVWDLDYLAIWGNHSLDFEAWHDHLPAKIRDGSPERQAWPFGAQMIYAPDYRFSIFETSPGDIPTIMNNPENSEEDNAAAAVSLSLQICRVGWQMFTVGLLNELKICRGERMSAPVV